MSIITLPAAIPASLPAVQKKAFNLANLPAIINGKIAFRDDEEVKPSAIRMDKSSALASMGGKANPVSFTSGLMFSIAAFAYGQGNIEGLTKGLPSFASFAVRHGCSLVASGKGITAGNLKAATLSAITAMLELSPAVKKAAAVTRITANQATSGEETIAVVDVAAVTTAAVAKNEAAHDALWAEYGDRLAAENKNLQAAKMAPRFVDIFATAAAANMAQAVEDLREMAKICGFVLVAADSAAAAAAAAATAQDTANVAAAAAAAAAALAAVADVAAVAKPRSRSRAKAAA